MGSCNRGHTPSVKHLTLAAALVWASACEDVSRAQPGAFQLGLPADGAIVSADQLTFSWSEAAGASGYVLEVDGLAPRAALGTSLGGGGFALTPGATYTWRVSAGTVRASNAPFHFTVAPDAPQTFMQEDPAARADAVPVLPTFRWTTSQGAARYELQVASDAAFSSVLADLDTLPPEAISATLDAPLPAGTQLYWRVLAIDSVRTTTATNAPSAFTTAAIPGTFAVISPAPGATGVPLSAAFSWSASAGADGYTFALDGAAPIELPASVTSFTPAAPLDSAKGYAWHVTAHNAQGTRDVAAMFTTGTGPGPFSVIAPAPGAGGQALQPTLSWTSSAAASTYSVQLATDAAFTPPLLFEDDAVTTTSATVPATLNPNTTYYWRVVAMAAAGTRPADGAPFSFTTAPAPTAPVLQAPYSGIMNWVNAPNFAWVPAQFADQQVLQIALDSAFTNVVFDSGPLPATTSRLQLPQANALAGGTTYYWHVSATGPSGSAASDVFSFSTGAVPGPFMQLTPFTWTASPNATKYELQIAFDSGFTRLVSDTSLGGTQMLNNPACPLAPNTTYYWRVYATAPGGKIMASNAPLAYTTPSSSITGGILWATRHPTPNVPRVGSAFAVGADGVYAGVSVGGTWYLEKYSLTDGTPLWEQTVPFDSAMPVAIVLGPTDAWVVSNESQTFRIERRDLATGNRVAAFGDGGVIESPLVQYVTAVAAASDGTSLYVAGDAYAYYVEKRALDTGAPDPAFGTGGFITSDTGTQYGDNATGLALLPPALYLYGRETAFDVFGNPELMWRVEARNLSDGTLITTFADGGVLDVDPSSTDDTPTQIAAEPGALYLAGDDTSFGQSEWNLQTVDPQTGASLASWTHYFGGVGDSISGVAAAGMNAYLVGPATGRSWSIAATNNPTWGNNGFVRCTTATYRDNAIAVAVDATGVYALGIESDTNATGYRWRVEKRNR
jgi:hypothetical protein